MLQIAHSHFGTTPINIYLNDNNWHNFFFFSETDSLMRVKLKHTLSFMPFVSLYASTQTCENEQKEVF